MDIAVTDVRRAVLCVTLPFLSIAPLGAQPASTEWTAFSHTAAGDCTDGGKVDALERPGHLRLRFYATWRSYSEVDVELAGDGSGRARFHGKGGTPVANLGRFASKKYTSHGATGSTDVRVSPGVGKRAIETRQRHGDCQWRWDPR